MNLFFKDKAGIMLKRVFSFLIFFGLLLSVAGCGKTPAVSGPSANATEIALLTENAVNALIIENKDDYAAYYTPAEFVDIYSEYTGSFVGIGIVMKKSSAESYPLIIDVMPGHSAARSGVKAGDSIIGVNGENILSADIDEVARKIKGEAGTFVDVEILPGSSFRSKTLSIEREIIESKTVNGTMLENTDGIAYIAIRGFTNLTAGEFVTVFNALNQESEIKSLILDLRNNSGGSVDAALEIASFFVPAGEVVFWQKKQGNTLKTSSLKGDKLTLPLICLQNAGSASASEMVIGAIKDHGVGITLGELSFGKGITQIISMLESGAGLRYTESKYFTPAMYDLHGKGIEPQVEVIHEDYYPDATAPDMEKDIQLARAVKILS
jgi:carboxyl-terminal processing protease